MNFCIVGVFFPIIIFLVDRGKKNHSPNTIPVNDLVVIFHMVVIKLIHYTVVEGLLGAMQGNNDKQRRRGSCPVGLTIL